MKKLLTFIFIATLFLGVHHALAVSDCTNLNDGNFESCCTGVNPEGDPNSCQDYAAANNISLPPPATTTTTTTNNQCSTIADLPTYHACCNGTTTDTQQCVAFYYAQTNPAPGTTGSTGVPAGNLPNGVFSTNTSSIDPSVFTAINNTSTTSSASAQGSSCSNLKFDSLFAILIWIKCFILNAIIPLIFAAAFVMFLWGVLKFIRATEKTDKDESKQLIINGLIGLFVMVSVWGIVGVVSKTFGFTTYVPSLQTSSTK